MGVKAFFSLPPAYSTGHPSLTTLLAFPNAQASGGWTSLDVGRYRVVRATFHIVISRKSSAALTAIFITIGPFDLSVFMSCLAVSLDLTIHSESAISKGFLATAAGLRCALFWVMPSKRP